MINKVLNKLGYTIYNRKFHKKNYFSKSGFNPLEQIFYHKLHKDFFFIQIGANDGVSYDPIYHLIQKENLSGIALEPLPDIFKKLKENYKNKPNIHLINKAIHNNLKQTTIYRVDNSKCKYPEWTKGTSSFNKYHHLDNGIDENDINEEVVECLSFNELLKEYKIKSVDLLQIDTEGYDYHIISEINFDKISPSIISFEHGLCDKIMTWAQFQELQKLLIKHNYNIVMLKYDAIAYKRDGC